MGTEATVEAPSSIRAFLPDLASTAWSGLRDSVDRASDWLQVGHRSEGEVAALGARLVELAGHPKWEVRRAVAHAVQHLPHYTFHAAITPLLTDSNQSVQLAAKRTRARWTEAAHSDVLRDQHSELLQEWLGDIEQRHGPQTREAAMRLAERYAELLMREAHHELARVIEPLGLSLTRVQDQLAQPRPDHRAVTKGLEVAQDRVKLLTAILNELRELTAEVTPEVNSEALRTIVTDAVSLVRDRLHGETRSFTAEVEIDAGLRLEGHRVRLLMAFSNLIQNAVESYEKKPGQRRLVIRAREDQGGHVVLEFTDYGCGMSEEVRRDAFQLYSSSKDNGTGFGLPLATKIIKSEHHGSISLASTRGKGTTVTVVLPISQALDGR